MLRALVGLASCLVPGRRTADKRKREDDVPPEEAGASKAARVGASSAAAAAGDARPAKRAAVARGPASLPQDQHQQYSMQKARSTDAVPCSSGGKRYGMDPSRLQGSDSETEQQHSSQQPQRGQMHNGQPTTRKRPASAAGTQASRDRPTSPLAAAAAALRPVLGQQHAAAAQPSRGSQQAVSMQQRQQQEQQHSAVQPADAAQPAAARQAPPPAPQPRPPPAFVKGQPVWYRQRDGAEVEASVSGRQCSCACTAAMPSLAGPTLRPLEGRQPA